MLRQLAGSGNAPVESLTVEQLRTGLQKLGWEEEGVDVIFVALDSDDSGSWDIAKLKWLEIEKKRQIRKDLAKRQAMADSKSRRTKGKFRTSDSVMDDFKVFLRRKYGHYVKAWRNGLSPDGGMTLLKNDFFKAISRMGWQGDVRVLWQTFDRDNSGYVSIEELDARNAALLAHFHSFVMKRFGSASTAYRAFDKYNRKRIRQQEFVAALKKFEFTHPAKPLFPIFDVDNVGSVMEKDFLFLDKWKPSPFLAVSANFEAAEEFKAVLLKNYGNFLKAWRHLLDADSSNRCNWDEFSDACKATKFTGDAAGAWRALDDDFSGFITLRELDPVSSNTLASFRRWADEEFGGVRYAYGVFDSDGSNQVTFREFRRACRIYGFDGNVHTLFRALDVQGSNTLSMDEVSFLDDWEFTKGEEAYQEAAPNDVEPQRNSTASTNLQQQACTTTTTDYQMIGPGPAAYAMPTTVGAGPMMPMVKFSGAYSFRRKNPMARLPGMARDGANFPAPGDYYSDNSIRGLLYQTKPSWGFGSAPRPVVKPSIIVGSSGPGPGDYGASKSLASPPRSAICTPRRPLRVHPLFAQAPNSAHSARGPAPSLQWATAGL